MQINSQQNDAESTIPDYWSSYISKKSVELDGSDQGSSPRTPAELNSISGMPSSIATETELSSRGKDLSDVGQEVSEPSVAVVIHPLSPDVGSMSYNPLISEYLLQERILLYAQNEILFLILWNAIFF